MTKEQLQDQFETFLETPYEQESRMIIGMIEKRLFEYLWVEKQPSKEFWDLYEDTLDHDIWDEYLLINLKKCWELLTK